MLHKRIKRIVIFLSGLFVAAFGVGLIVKSQLGVSPVMSLPYVVSLALPISFGTCVAIEQILLLAGQKVILGTAFELKSLWQLPTAVIFGLFCDVALMSYSYFSLNLYEERLAALLLGILVLACGLSLQLIANVSVTAPEGFMLALARVFKSTYAKVKVIADWIFIATSVGLSLWLFESIEGIREGTLISALGVGSMVGLLLPVISQRVIKVLE